MTALDEEKLGQVRETPSLSRVHTRSSSCSPVSAVSTPYAAVAVQKLDDYKENLKSSASTIAQANEDPDLVDWVGDDDPTKPQNWAKRRKWVAVALGQLLV